MTVAEINALLYSPNHARDRLERALRVEALSHGWRSSFETLLRTQATSGNAGLMPEAAAHPAAPGFHRVTVTGIERESADVLSLTMQSADGETLLPAMPGQYGVVRLHAAADSPPFFRSYSISGPFARSGIAAHWDVTAYRSILELAEACDVPVRWSCRSGVCHNCESGLVSGAVLYDPAPLEMPADGNVLVCCSRPGSDLVIDL